MKGSPPTAGREYGEEWAPCVKGVIFLLSEKNRLFLSIEEKNPESAKNWPDAQAAGAGPEKHEGEKAVYLLSLPLFDPLLPAKGLGTDFGQDLL